MFTEYEISSMLSYPEIKEATGSLKKEFTRNEAPYLEINDHDFFSLIMMAPTVAMAMADGNISLIEELALNKKARKLSKGGYFMRKDPVVDAMKFLIKSFDKYSDQFFAVLKLAMEKSIDIERITGSFDDSMEITYEKYKNEVLKSPYILIRFIVSFFLENDEHIIKEKRVIRHSEYLQMKKIGERIGLDKIPVFMMFCQTFEHKG